MEGREEIIWSGHLGTSKALEMAEVGDTFDR